MAVVRFTVAARRDLAALPNADVVKLHGQKIATWRLRVGKWRVRYRREDEATVVVSFGDRKDAYR